MSNGNIELFFVIVIIYAVFVLLEGITERKIAESNKKLIGALFDNREAQQQRIDELEKQNDLIADYCLLLKGELDKEKERKK